MGLINYKKETFNHPNLHYSLAVLLLIFIKFKHHPINLHHLRLNHHHLQIMQTMKGVDTTLCQYFNIIFNFSFTIFSIILFSFTC